MASGWQRCIVFQEIHGWELVSKPVISLKKSWGVTTVERLADEKWS